MWPASTNGAISSEETSKKGEKGIKIIAPTPFKKKIEQEKLDPDTKLPLRDENGDIITEEKTVQIPMYKPVVVFDVQQTAGKPLAGAGGEPYGDVQNYGVFMEALRRSAPVPIFFEKLAENMDGYFSVDKQRIAVREGMSEVQTVCAAVHEIAHPGSTIRTKSEKNIRRLSCSASLRCFQTGASTGISCRRACMRMTCAARITIRVCR